MSPREEARSAAAALQRERVAACPLCGSEELETVATRDRYRMELRTDACQACGFLFTNPRPTAEGIAELYARWYRPLYGHEVVPTPAGIEARGLHRRAAHTLGVLERYGLARAGALLEVGCGAGVFLRATGLLHPGLRRVGVEPDPRYAEFARGAAGCEVVAELSEVQEDGFDVAVLVHALEHFADPIALLRQVKTRLRTGGLLYLDVPDAARYASIRDLHLAHLGHFTAETLLRAAAAVGFSPLLLEPHDPPANLPSLHGVFRPGDRLDGARAVREIEATPRECGAPPGWRARPGPEEFFGWFARQAWTRPWAVLGKGPSFSRRGELDLAEYHLLGLNHVCREVRVDLAHAIDLDVVEQLGDTLLERAGALVMPWRPHVDFRPGELDLAQAAARIPVLGRLAEEGRLLWYNCSTAPEPRPSSPVVRVCFFSGEAGIRLLGLAGVETIRTLGIDGGTGYAGEFKDLTPLENGVKSFDAQSEAIAVTVEELELDLAPLFEQPEPEGVPFELAGLDAVVVTVDPDARELELPAERAEAIVLLGAPADHPKPVELVRALHAALVEDGQLYVCVGRKPAGSSWTSARERFHASRWWLAEGFALEREGRIADGRRFLALRRRDSPSPAWSLGDAPPEVTIALVTHESSPEAIDLIGAIRAFTRTPYRLRVVDNASAGGVRTFLRGLAHEPGVHVTENPDNRGCAAATNQALRAAETEAVIYLCASHALVLDEGWERALLAWMADHHEVGIAGDTWASPYLLASERYAPGWDPSRLAPEERLHVQGGAWVGRRSLFERVGWFAEDRYPQGGMDVELSFRLLSLGEKLGRHPAISAPPWPERALARPGVLVVHPAEPEDRAGLRRRVWGCPHLPQDGAPAQDRHTATKQV